MIENNYHLNGDEISNEELISRYETCQPIGSGPKHLCKQICRLIETIANHRGLKLPVPDEFGNFY